MGLVFAYAYQHHDAHLLQPVLQELVERGHNVMGQPQNLYAFLSAVGPRALVLVADLATEGHIPGRAAVQMARQQGVGSVSIQHGCPAAFPNPDDPPTDTVADTYCLWGPYWTHWFHSKRQIVTGNPAMDRVKRLSMEENGTGLLVPCFREDARHESLQWMNTEERTDYYIRKAQGYDCNWIIRPHPSDWKHKDRQKAYARMAEALSAQVFLPGDADLYQILAGAEIVLGTSTVVLEGLVFGCEIVPLFMEYLPDAYDIEDFFGPQDFQASRRVADEVERAMFND